MIESLPNRASDGGPDTPMLPDTCPACGSKRGYTGRCIACESMVCTICGYDGDDGIWCAGCLTALVDGVLYDVECGAEIGG